MSLFKKFLVYNFLIGFIFSEEPINSYQKVLAKVASSSDKKEVIVDNKFFQTYNDVTGIWNFVKSGETIKLYAKEFSVSEEHIIKINNMPENSLKFYKSEWIFIPYGSEYLSKMHSVGVDRIKWIVPAGEYIWPVEGVRISSHVGRRWGRMHPGIDIATPTGSIVLAAMDGEISQTNNSGAYGKSIVIMHNEVSDYTTRYAHLSQVFVKKGDKVKKGQIIAYSGNTGRSTGPHLHFEVRCKDIIINPEFYLPDFRESMEAIAAFAEHNETSSGIGGELESE